MFLSLAFASRALQPFILITLLKYQQKNNNHTWPQFSIKAEGLPPFLIHPQSLWGKFTDTLVNRFHLLVSIGTGTSSLVIFGAIEIRTVVEGPISSANGSPPSLVQKVPVETGERPVLCTFMLHEQRALLSSELLQISMGIKGAMGYYYLPMCTGHNVLLCYAWNRRPKTTIFRSVCGRGR